MQLSVKMWEKNLKSIIESQATVDEKLDFVQKYIEWTIEQFAPDCDNCERIHPDDIGDYVADHREAYYDR